MSRTFPYHLFAHENGRYQTVRAMGLTEGQARSLEQFIFGQTNDQRYLSSLPDEPGVIWRVIDGATALTRVHQGANDQHGRATLRFETVLVPASSSASAAQRLAEFVLAEWDVSAGGASIRFRSASPLGVLHPEKISDVVLAVQRGERVTQRASGFSLRDVAKIVATSLHVSGFSLSFKCLSRTAPVLVNLVSLEVSLTHSPATSAQPRPSPRKTATMSEQRVSSSKTPVAIAIYVGLVLQLLLFLAATNRAKAPTGMDKMQSHILNRFDSVDKAVFGLQEALTRVGTDAEGNGTKIEEVSRALKEETAGIAESLQQLNRSLSELSKSWQAVGARLDQRLNGLEQDLSERADKASKNLSGLRSELVERVESVDQHVNDLTSRFREEFPPRAEENPPAEQGNSERGRR